MRLVFFLLLILILSNVISFSQDNAINYRRNDNAFLEQYKAEDKQKYFPLDKLTNGTGVWTELNPKVPRVDYIGVDFINADTGWAVGLYGAVIKTTNGGTNWQTIDAPTAQILLKVHSYNGEVVMLVGHNGTILRSDDGGNTFTLLSGITTQELWGVRMLNDTLGWICGRNQTLLRTTDAGLTWQSVVTGFNYHYWQFDFLTEEYFMITCSQGKVLKTTNGGISFTISQAGNTEDLFTIDIIDSLHIAAAGSYGKNVFSSNGGNNWIENGTLTSSSVNWIQFIDLNTGFAAVESSWSLYKTTNRGQSWSLAGFYKTGEWQFELVYNATDGIGYGVGAALTVTKTEDGFYTGRNLILNKNWSDVFFINEMKGFFASAAQGEKLYKTEDGGITCEVLENSPEWNYDILFVDSLTGFLGSNTIYKTTDGGVNWYETNGSGQTTKIFFINSLTGWAIGGQSIYKTTDCGENWFVQNNNGWLFSSIHFIDSLNGWASQLGGRPFKTTDGGNNWNEQINLDIWESDDIYFFDSLKGFLIESPQKLYKTVNGGVDWLLQLNSQYFLRNFSWITTTHGFIIGDGIYETNDSGNNWQEILEIRNVGLRKFHAPLNYLGYSVGNQGLIYKYVDSSYVPVELTSFTSFYDAEKIVLSWETASEINNQGFQIERLKNSKIEKLNDWEKIGFVNGNGTTTEPQSYSFVDENMEAGKYQYRLKQVDYDGTFKYSNTIEIEIGIPAKFSLQQNYPNPFNPSTTISYQLPKAGNVTLKVFDILGKEVATLVNEEKRAGNYEVKFEASKLASGIYYYQIKTGKFVQTRKMILLK